MSPALSWLRSGPLWLSGFRSQIHWRQTFCSIQQLSSLVVIQEQIETRPNPRTRRLFTSDSLLEPRDQMKTALLASFHPLLPESLPFFFHYDWRSVCLSVCVAVGGGLYWKKMDFCVLASSNSFFFFNPSPKPYCALKQAITWQQLRGWSAAPGPPHSLAFSGSWLYSSPRQVVPLQSH